MNRRSANQIGVGLALWALATTSSCMERRNYPLLQFGTGDVRNEKLELGAAALLPHGLVVAMSEKDSEVLYEVLASAGSQASLKPLGVDAVDLFAIEDPSQDCPEGPKFRACRDRNYRHRVPLKARPIRWLPAADGKVRPPHHVEDLSPWPCDKPKGECLPQVIGITEFSTIGRVTGFREDTVARGREETERLFLLELQGEEWVEVKDPRLEQARQRLSDWGRASCGTDLVVEGLAVDADKGLLFFGVNRCKGPVQRVLSWPLREAQAGRPASIQTVADGIVDQAGRPASGPAEGLSSLDVAYGHIWATSSWNHYGDPIEVAYGGRMLAVQDGHLVEVPLPGKLRDRSDALVMLPNERAARSVARDPLELVPALSALVLFDNDVGADDETRPNGTVVHARTPGPKDGWIDLVSLAESPLTDTKLALNGFDLRWYWRDHRLGQISVLVDRLAKGPGAWTSAVGGAWQVRLGNMARGLKPIFGKQVGTSRQAAEMTDFRGVSELDFTGYRAILSVVPQERSGSDRSVARTLDEVRSNFEITVPLPRSIAEGGGVVLQGFTIDTTPRADGGICLSAMDLAVEPVEAGGPIDQVKLRAALLGGICNDFDTRDAGEHHGLTTDALAGVRVTLYFAAVEGALAHRGSMEVADRDRPGPRTSPTALAFADAPLPERAPYKKGWKPEAIGDHRSKDGLACVVVNPATREALPLDSGAHQHGPPSGWNERMVTVKGQHPGEAGHLGLGLSGFAYAFDLRGFDPGLWPEAYADVSELEALSQNNYLFRYMMRVWPRPEGGLFIEGGASHGLHVGGLGRDNAQPTARMVRADVTWWEGLSEDPLVMGMTDPWPSKHDPNQEPEDGFLRWAFTQPTTLAEVARCSEL